MTDLREVVESIGALADLAEASRWAVCRAVADAYAELGLYERGLTAGLVVRLKRESDTIYNYRDAWRLREELKSDTVSETLPYSHYAAMYDLRERYDLTLDECHEWLGIAAANSLSVRVMRQEVETAHRENEQKALKRIAQKMGKLIRRVYEESEFLKMPEKLRQNTKIVLAAIEDWNLEILEWVDKQRP